MWIQHSWKAPPCYISGKWFWGEPQLFSLCQNHFDDVSFLFMPAHHGRSAVTKWIALSEALCSLSFANYYYLKKGIKIFIPLPVLIYAHHFPILWIMDFIFILLKSLIYIGVIGFKKLKSKWPILGMISACVQRWTNRDFFILGMSFENIVAHGLRKKWEERARNLTELSLPSYCEKETIYTMIYNHLRKLLFI